MDSSTHQHVYAANLRQNFGYPLRNPKPNSRLGQPYVKEGLQIGDVGYVDDYGEFIWLFNIKFPLPGKEKLPEEFHDRNLNPPDKLIEFAQPVAEQAIKLEKVFMTGVVPNLEEQRATYDFTATSKAGALLILPEGATLFKLEDKQKLEEFRQHAVQHALQWCRYARRDSLYLITAAYKTKTWTLGSFYDGSLGGKILVHRQSHDGTAMYRWQYQFNVDDQQGPGNNCDVNQTVLMKGFKITVRWDWFPVIERVERSERWFARVLAPLWLIRKFRKWLSQTKIEYFPARNLSQPLHPLDVINRVLLDKNPSTQVVITHDNDWIEMLDKGLSYEDLMQEGRLREFIENRYTWDLDSEHNAVYLRRKLVGTDSQREPPCDAEDSSPLSPLGDDARLAISNMRLESIDVDVIYAGVCILIQFGSTTRRTENKPHASVIEWDDVIMLPSDLPIDVTVCGVFQLGSTLGTREICTKLTINTVDLSDGAHMVRFSVGKAECHSTLLITLVRHFSQFEDHSSHDEISVFAEKTNLGFRALYSHRDKHKKEYLEDALECFQCALGHCGHDPTFRATALFNLATLKFLRCQVNGTYSKLTTPIELYGEALQLRDSGDPDRPMTLLLLAQALLFRYGREYRESDVMQIESLLAEIYPDCSRDRQTADAIIRASRFFQGVNSGDPAEVDKLLRDLDSRAYAPPYGFFDWPYMLHKLGVALWARFQLSMSLGDLDKSIALNKEALHLVPDGHPDRASMVTCLGTSFLRHLEVRGDLLDIDMSTGFMQLEKTVVTAFNNISSAGGATMSWQDLRIQMTLMSAVDRVFSSIAQQYTPAVNENLLYEWRKGDGTPTKCKRYLGTLLSFLQGEGEMKMNELLAESKVKWPFKEYKIKETTQVLQEYMPYFRSLRLGVASRSSVTGTGTSRLGSEWVDLKWVDEVEASANRNRRKT